MTPERSKTRISTGRIGRSHRPKNARGSSQPAARPPRAKSDANAEGPRRRILAILGVIVAPSCNLAAGLFFLVATLQNHYRLYHSRCWSMRSAQ